MNDLVQINGKQSTIAFVNASIKDASIEENNKYMLEEVIPLLNSKITIINDDGVEEVVANFRIEGFYAEDGRLCLAVKPR